MGPRISKREKEQRLLAAMWLLEHIRKNGGKVRLLAAMLRTNETQLSHWGSRDVKRRLRVGPPTRLQLRLMTGYLQHLVVDNLQSLQILTSSQQLGIVERSLLLESLDPELTKCASGWSDNLRVNRERQAHLVQTVRELSEAGGNAAVPHELLQSVYDLADIPDQQDLDESKVDFDQLLVRVQFQFMEQTVKSTLQKIQYLLNEDEEREDRQEQSQSTEDGDEESVTP